MHTTLRVLLIVVGKQGLKQLDGDMSWLCD